MSVSEFYGWVGYLQVKKEYEEKARIKAETEAKRGRK